MEELLAGCLVPDVTSAVNQIVINNDVNLEELLADYFLPERIDDEANFLACNNCNAKVSWEKYFRLLGTPSILVIQLKRFLFDKDDGTCRKVNTRIKIPLNIDLQAFQEGGQETAYELLSIVNHVGKEFHEGHYTTIVREANHSWIEFDDAVVKPFDITELDNSEPYIIMYRRLPAPEQLQSNVTVVDPSSAAVDNVCSIVVY